jgi:hypothetical protein
MALNDDLAGEMIERVMRSMTYGNRQAGMTALLGTLVFPLTDLAAKGIIL